LPRAIKKLIAHNKLSKHVIKKMSKHKKHMMHAFSKLVKKGKLPARLLKKLKKLKSLPKHVKKKVKKAVKKKAVKGKGTTHGCGPHTHGSVHCGTAYKTTCINRNAPINSLTDAWKQCGKVKGCAKIMRWAKDGKYYLRSASDKVVKSAASKNTFQKYLPKTYKCTRL